MIKEYRHKKTWMIARETTYNDYIIENKSWIIPSEIIQDSEDREEVKQDIIISSDNFEAIIRKINELTQKYESYVNIVGGKSSKGKGENMRRYIMRLKQELILFCESMK